MSCKDSSPPCPEECIKYTLKGVEKCRSAPKRKDEKSEKNSKNEEPIRSNSLNTKLPSMETIHKMTVVQLKEFIKIHEPHKSLPKLKPDLILRADEILRKPENVTSLDNLWLFKINDNYIESYHNFGDSKSKDPPNILGYELKKLLTQQMNKLINECTGKTVEYTSVKPESNSKRLLLIDFRINKPPEIILLIDIETSVKGVLTAKNTSMIDTYIIWNICKSQNPKFKIVKTSSILKKYLEDSFKKSTMIQRYWVAVDFENPKYEETVRFLVRSNFAIKGVSSLPGTVVNDYNTAKRYLVLESISTKYNNYLNVSSVENLNKLLKVANNIKKLEGSIKKDVYICPKQITTSVFKNVILVAGETAGSFVFYKDVNNNKILAPNKEVVGYEKPKLTHTTHKSLTTDVDLDKHCKVVTPKDDFIYHTHPYICNKFSKTYRPRIYDLPSLADLSVTISTNIFRFIRNQEFYMHIIYSINCIYTIQLHPFWIHYVRKSLTKGILIGDKSMNMLSVLLYYLNFLFKKTNNLKLDKLISKGVHSTEDLNTILFTLNNNLTINELSKNADHTKFEKYEGKEKESEKIRKDIKNVLFSNGILRNVNLLMVSTVMYPFDIKKYSDIPRNADGTNYDISRFSEYLHNFITDNIGDESKYEKIETFLDTIIIDDTKLPYYSMDDSLIESYLS